MDARQDLCATASVSRVGQGRQNDPMTVEGDLLSLQSLTARSVPESSCDRRWWSSAMLLAP